NGMPRRSRRSPRHLRVSGQRRRRYRDERYPTQSPMPLTVACASPEMASGKVWIRYPVVRPQDQQPEEVPVQDTSAIEAVEAIATPVAVVETVTAAPVTVEPATMEPVTAEPVVVEPVVAAEPVIVDTPEIVEPAAVEPAPVEAPAVEAPQAIAPVTIDAEPVTVEPEVVETAPVVEAPVETIVPAGETVVEAPVTEAAPTAPAEPVKAETPVSKPVVVAGDRHATAPMTRAPAPDYVPEAPRHSTWVRPPFAFEGKGAAGGHSATRKATAEPTRPQPVE
ncbi:TPA: ribonuclease E, partial [Klebsiella variicola]|nr:ribonuclease E [Klebsiella variicola]